MYFNFAVGIAVIDLTFHANKNIAFDFDFSV